MDGMETLTNLINLTQPSVEVEDKSVPAPTQPITPAQPLAAPPTATQQVMPAPTTGPQTPPLTGQAPVPQQGKAKGKGGPQSPKIGTVVSRSNTLAAAQSGNGLAVPEQVNNAIQITLTPEQYQANLVELLNQSIAMASHDRAMALSMLQVHLDRGEELDKLSLSMPVSAAISDNTTACLKSMELAQKAGRVVLDSAKLLVDAKKADDTNLIKAFQAQLAQQKIQGDNDGGWGDAADLPED